MSTWRSTKFWRVFVVLFIPALFVFALPTAMFFHSDTPLWAGILLYCCQVILTVGVPYVIARRIALGRKREACGFEVIPIKNDNQNEG